MTTAHPAKPPHPCIIGLTGGIGSGKSTVADAFARHGIEIVDTDQIAHALTAPQGAALPAIVNSFGAAMLREDGALDRSAMRALVFSEPARKAELENILHPMIRAASLNALAQCSSPYTLLAVPLLVETGHYIPLCRRTLVIDCPLDVQLQRVMARSKLTHEEALRIISSQASREARLEIADDVIDNSASLDELQTRIFALHQRYLDLAAKLTDKP